MDIYASFSRIDANPGRDSFFSGFIHALRSAGRYFIPALAALALIFAVFFKLRETPAVQAAELLRKAAAAEQSRPAAPHRIAIRARSRKLTRWIGHRAVIDKTQATLEAEAYLEPLFRAARYSWEDPLTARSFQAWRAQLADKRDEVSGGGPRNYTIRTETNDGELRAASLTLRGTDLHPIEGRLEFRNNEMVELAELPEAPFPPVPAVTGAPMHVTPHPAHPIPSGGAVERPGPEPGPAEELQVVAALHRLGADLGDPVEINRSGAQIVVSGLGIAASRQ